MTANKIIKDLDSADLFLRDRVNSKPAPLNEYDIEILLDIAKACNNAVDLINRYETEIEKLQETKERLMYNLKAVLDERADHTEAIKELAEKVHIEIHEALESNYKARKEHIDKWKDPNAYIGGGFVSMCDGKITALQSIDCFINNIVKEMVEQRKEDENGKELS